MTTNIATSGNTWLLQKAMMSMPQARPDIDVITNHYQIDGVYVRHVFRKKDVTIVGKTHKFDHITIIAMGKIAIVNGSDKTIYVAGDTFITKAGSKRATHALEDSILITVHRTDNVKIEDIESELIVDEPEALYDCNNQLKDPSLAYKPNLALGEKQ